MNISSFGKEQLPSIIKDPFLKYKITKISVSYSKNWTNDNFTARGCVEFENGNTKGEQKFTGETFDDVVLQIKAMLDNLK